MKFTLRHVSQYISSPTDRLTDNANFAAVFEAPDMIRAKAQRFNLERQHKLPLEIVDFATGKILADA